jgi:serine/threonine protein kinase
MDTVVDGRYKLETLLGEGTFGDVWKASDTRLAGRPVAVKFLKAEFLEHAGAVARFEAEADALAQMSHPNIVGVIDRGLLNGQRYIVMEFVEGNSLTTWIREHSEQGAVTALSSVLALFDQLCAGLEAAHAVRNPGAIVHRDLKPDNVILRVLPGGELSVKVLDFGIAQLGRRKSTQTGALMGTPLYMAPEQAMGQVAMIGPWTDVFSLGVLLVETLTGRQQATADEPWWGTSLQRSREVRELVERMRKDIPSPIVDVVVRCLQAQGSERFADAGALRSALRQASVKMQGSATQSHPQWLTLPARVERTKTPVLGHHATSGVSETKVSRNAETVSDDAFPWVKVTIAVALMAVLAAVGIVAMLINHDASRRSSLETVHPSRTGTRTVANVSAAVSRSLDDHAAISEFLTRWERMRQHTSNAEPFERFYATSLKFHGVTRVPDFEMMARENERVITQGGSFTVHRSRTDWSEEREDEEAVPAACRQVGGVRGAVLKVRVWATEVRTDRHADIGCPRLEGRYLLRLRETPNGLRICHETWSIDEGICASCPTAPLCARRR